MFAIHPLHSPARRPRILSVVTGTLLKPHEPHRSHLFVRAAELSRRERCDVEVLHVAPPTTDDGSDSRAEQAALGELVDRVNREYDVEFSSTFVRSSNRAASVSVAAARSNAVLVLKQAPAQTEANGPRDSDRSTDLQTDIALQRQLPVPIWFIKSDRSVQRVVAAVDGAEIAEPDYTCCSTAQSFNDIFDAELKVLLVCPPRTLCPARELARTGHSAAHSALGDIHTLGKPQSARLGALIEQLELEPEQLELQLRTRERGLAEGARRLGADLVVTSPESSGRHLLTHAPCDVLISPAGKGAPAQEGRVPLVLFPSDPVESAAVA